MQATRERIRIALDVSKADALQDKLTLSTPDFWRGTDVQFELGLFYGATLLDVSNLQQIRLIIRESTTDPTGTIVMDKTISSFDNTLAQATWDDDTKQHGLISFIPNETSPTFAAGVTSKDYWLVITALTLTGEKITLGTSICTVREDGDGSGSGPAAGDPTYYTAVQSDARYVYKAGDTMTGLLQFSGTAHAGIKLNNLTTGQRDALTPSAGMAIYNTTTGRYEFRDSAAWRQYVIIAGDTMTGLLQFSGTTHAGLRLNSLTTTERDALSGSQGMTIYNTTTGTVEFRDASVWYRAARVAAGGGVANGIALWLDGNTLTGDANLTWSGTLLSAVSQSGASDVNLHIGSAGTGSGSLVIRGSTSFGAIQKVNNANTVEYWLVGNSSTDTLLIRNAQNTPTAFYTNNIERWQITSAGILQSNGAQTIQSSSGVLTLATGGNNSDITLNPHGSGNTNILGFGVFAENTGALGNIPSSTGLSLGYNKSGGDAEANLIWGRTGSNLLQIGYWNGSTLTNVANFSSTTLSIASLTSRSVLFAGASGAIAQGTIVWDESTKQLGLGITSGLSFNLHLKASAASLGVESTTSTAEIDMINSVGNKCYMIYTGQDLQFRVFNASTPAITIIGANPNKIAFFGLTTATYDLSLEGNSARTLALERHTTANTAGNNLTLLAGGATSGATDKAGGTLLLSAGTATGIGGSAITFHNCRVTGATGGTSDTGISQVAKLYDQGLLLIGPHSAAGADPILFGRQISFHYDRSVLICVERAASGFGGGGNLRLCAGSAPSGDTNITGGTLQLYAGISTGNRTSKIELNAYGGGASGTSDAALYTAIFSGNLGAFYPVSTGQDLGADVAASKEPWATAWLTDIKLKRGGARSIILSRSVADADPGYALTLQAGGALSAGTNLAGGDLILAPGLSTGNANSKLRLQACTTGASGTADNALVDRIVVTGAKALTDAATSIFEIALASGAMTGGTLIATIEASDGTDHQAFTQIVAFSAVNKAGAYTTTVTVNASNDAKAASAGTLTTSWAFTTGSNKVTMQVTPTGSLTETTYRVTYVVINNSPQAVTIL